jgi:hypothetical protein
VCSIISFNFLRTVYIFGDNREPRCDTLFECFVATVRACVGWDIFANMHATE